jgi:diguanylate cyclase (GGDEF)-like protein
MTTSDSSSSSARPAADTSVEAPAGDRSLHALLSVIDDLTVETDEAGLLRSTLEHVAVALGATGGATFLGETAPTLSCAWRHAIQAEQEEALQEMAASALASQGALVDNGPHSWNAATPLVSKGRPLGVLTLVGEPSTLPEAALLVALGKQIGTGLENVRLYAELRRSSAEVSLLHRITSVLALDPDAKPALPAFARELAGVQSFDRLACAFVNESGDYLEVSTDPPDLGWGLGSVIPVVGSGPGFVVLNDLAVVQPDLVHRHRFIEDLRLLEEGLRSYVLLPLNSRGRSVGVLGFASRRSQGFDDATARRLQPVADAAALALENVRLLQKTRQMSITDEVTPLFNYRFFHQILDRELKLVDRYRSVLSLIFMDLDHFKPINDRYGHLRGSRVLREVGFLLREACRETDYPARYGGDEFVIILPQTEGVAATKLAQKLRRIIEDHSFLQEEGIDARIGASLGVATYPAEATSKEALIRLADERMYGDKDARKRNT